MQVSAATIAPMQLRDLADLRGRVSLACVLLKTMSNEWRQMNLCHLAEGEKTVGELQELLGLSQSALSQHLAVLRRERFVKARMHAQSVNYSLVAGEATRLMDTLDDLFCGAEDCGN